MVWNKKSIKEIDAKTDKQARIKNEKIPWNKGKDSRNILKQCLQCQKQFKTYAFLVSRLYCSKDCYNNHLESIRIKNICKICQKEFYDKNCKTTKRSYCSKKCYFNRPLKKNSKEHWIQDSFGYLVHWDGKRWIKQHRSVIEQHIGRKLNLWEHVHHKNGNKTDNRIENLDIVINRSHRGKIICPYCEKEFFIH